MVSQTVLLRGVNDDPAMLAELMRALVESRGSSPTTCTMATSPPARRACAPPSPRARR